MEQLSYNSGKKQVYYYKEETQKLIRKIEELKEELSIYKNELIKLNEALKESIQNE